MDYLTHHLLRRSAGRFPDKEALVFGDTRLSYEQVDRCTTALAGGLRQLGTNRTDRVGVLLQPSLAQALSIFAISQAGGAFVPIHHSLFPEQVKHIVNDCGMKGLVLTAAHLRDLGEVIEDCPSLQFAILVGGRDDTAATLRTATWEQLSADRALDSVPDVGISKDLTAILYTSGSTGRPKGVMLSHANMIAGASIISKYLGIRSDDRTLAALPFTFDAGLNQIMTAFQQAATLVMTNFLFANDLVQALHAERITGLAGVPTLWSLLARSTAFRRQEFPHLQYITNTGGRLPLNVLATLRERLPSTKVFLMYGLTEAFRSTYLPPDQVDQRPTSIGKAIPDTEILVINDDGKICQPGEIGELVHRGPTVSMGYWGRPELTAQVLRPYPLPVDGCASDEMVCYSGDLVSMDDEGYLYFVGRRDNLIKCSGFRVSPTEVEETLHRSGMVEQAAVIGVSDEVLGQTIKAFVVPRTDQPLDTGQLIEHCAAQMPSHMVPKSIETLAQLPKTTSGKVDYPALRQRAGSTPSQPGAPLTKVPAITEQNQLT